MGYDASCTLRFDGRTARGTAYLEQHDLIFRGPNRLAISLKDITEARADGGTLHVRFEAKRAAFEIGAAASKWAERITNPPSRLDKLGIKAGMRVVLLGIDDEQFEQELRSRGARVSRRMPATTVDAVFYAAHTRVDLTRLRPLSQAIAPSGAVWVLRPKGSSTPLRAGRPEITEADTMAAGKTAGLVDVKVVSFSQIYSAEKYMIPRSSRPAAAASAARTQAAKQARPHRSSSPAPHKP
jgi:hypothetical protein